MTRPRRTKPDENQAPEKAKLVALGYTCIDTYNLPGNSLTPGENPLDQFVMDDSRPWLGWVQVEWKTLTGRKLFTPNEQWYFEAKGIWDFVVGGLPEPLAQWRQHGQPVVVAWEARQIVELFDAMEARVNRRASAAADSARCGAMRKT